MADGHRGGDVPGRVRMAGARPAGGRHGAVGRGGDGTHLGVTTVGYGDFAPVTATGRLIAAALMIAGIALLGVVTATSASWPVERVGEQDEASQAATRAQVAALTAEVVALREDLRRAREDDSAGSRV